MTGLRRVVSWCSFLTVTMVVQCAGAAVPAFFAMDTGTRDATHETPAEQVAVIAETGFAGAGPTYSTPEALREWLLALDERKLKMFALYLPLPLDGPEPVGAAIRESIRQLRGRDAVLWLYLTHGGLKPSDPAGDARAVEFLRQVAELCGTEGPRVALYPHTGFWLEKVDDAVRIARQVDRKQVGVTFNLCHWLKVDGKDLDTRLSEAMPWLSVVTVNGADTAGKDWKQLIQPLDRGDFGVARLLALLEQVGYRGPVGLQHYGIGGEAREMLQRSMVAWRQIQALDLLEEGAALSAWQAAADWSEVGAVKQDPTQPDRLVSEAGRGVIFSAGKAGYLLSKEPFGDVAMHVEFLIPKGSNSGVYFLGSHEVQVFDSFGVARGDYPGIECGGIYPEWVNDANVRGHAPAVNASRPAGEWQSFDVVYRAPRFDTAGKKTRNARFEKVVHNGVTVHEKVELFGTTRAGLPEAAVGPLRLQGDHGPVAYRNLRVWRLKPE